MNYSQLNKKCHEFMFRSFAEIVEEDFEDICDDPKLFVEGSSQFDVVQGWVGNQRLILLTYHCLIIGQYFKL